MAARGKNSLSDDPVKLTFLLFAVIAFMYFAAEVLQPLALAVLLSCALTPLARLLERRGLPRLAAVLVTVALAVGALGGIGYVGGQQLTARGKERADDTGETNE